MTLLVDRGDSASGSGAGRATTVSIPVARVALRGELASPPSPTGVVVLADAARSDALEAGQRQAAAALVRAGLATLQLDLLTREEEGDEILARSVARDLPVLADRLEGAIGWLAARPELRDLPIGLFGANTASAAALVAATRAPGVRAVVSRCGRPELAHEALREILCPTLWIVGGADAELLDAHHRALRRIGANARLHVVPGVGRHFDEPGALDDALRLASAWFREHLARPMHHPGPWTGSTIDAKPGSSSRAR